MGSGSSGHRADGGRGRGDRRAGPDRRGPVPPRRPPGGYRPGSEQPTQRVPREQPTDEIPLPPPHRPPPPGGDGGGGGGDGGGGGGDGGGGGGGDGATPRMPRKLTVTRVVVWRSRQFGQRVVGAFNRAARADGAHESGLTSLTYAVMFNYGSDAAMSVALANTLFFAAATAESKTKVALYLLLTVAPFALVAPVIGPALDKIQHGRRAALAVACVGSAFASVVMALYFRTWLLYPAALTQMVLSKSFTVLKAAITPRVLPPKLSLVKTNARLTTFGLGASVTFGGVAAGITSLFGSPGALWFSVLICLANAVLCLRIPKWVEVTAGEVPASITTRLPRVGPRGRQLMGRRVVVALWGNGSIRMLTGFITLFAAFVVKAQTQHEPAMQLVLLGIIGAAGGIGSFAGNAIGSRLRVGKRDELIIGCVAAALVSTVLAAVLAGIATAALVGLIGAVASALAKISLDALIQDDLPDRSRASAFGRSESILQLTWVLGGAIGVLIPAEYWIGFTVISAALAVGLVQTYLCRRGSSLIPGLGGNRPVRPDAGPQVNGRPPTPTKRL